MILETERLILREANNKDAEFIYLLLNEPAWLKNIGNKNINNLNDAKNYIAESLVKSYRKYGYGLYVVELKATQQAIGLCGLVNRPTLETVDIGYAISEKFHNKGFASEATISAIEEANVRYGFKKVLAITSPNNAASIKLLEKLHFEYLEQRTLDDRDDTVNTYQFCFKE